MSYVNTIRILFGMMFIVTSLFAQEMKLSLDCRKDDHLTPLATRVSPDGSVAVFAGNTRRGDCYLSAMDLNNGCLKWRISANEIGAKYYGLMAFSPDNRSLLMATSHIKPQDVILLDLSEGNVIRRNPVETGSLSEIAFGPRGETFFVAGKTKDGEGILKSCVEIRSLAADAPGSRLILRGAHGDLDITHMILSPNASQMALCLGNERIQIWDYNNRTMLSEAKTPDLIADLWVMDWSMDGALITIHRKRGLCFWDTGTMRCVHETGFPSSGAVSGTLFPRAMKIGSDENHVIAAFQNGSIWAYNRSNERWEGPLRWQSVPDHDNWGFGVTDLGQSRNFVYCAGLFDHLQAWSVNTGERLFECSVFKDGEWAFATGKGYYNASEMGSHFLKLRLNGSQQKVAKYADKLNDPHAVSAALGKMPGSESMQKQVEKESKPPSVVLRSTVSDDDKDRGAVGEEEMAREINEGQDMVLQNGHHEGVHMLVMDPAGEKILTASSDNSIICWRSDGFKLFQTRAADENSSHVTDAHFFPDGNSFVTYNNGEVIEWDLNGRQIRMYDKVEFTDYGFSVSPNGKWIACPDCIWRRDGSVKTMLEKEEEDFDCDELQFAGNDRLYAFGEIDDRDDDHDKYIMQSWNVRNGSAKTHFTWNFEYDPNEENNIYKQAISPDGKYFVVGLRGRLRAYKMNGRQKWEINYNWKEEWEGIMDGDEPESIAISDDGSQICCIFTRNMIVASRDGEVIHTLKTSGDIACVNTQITRYASLDHFRGKLEIWDKAGNKINEFDTMKEIYLYRVALSGDSRYIVSSGHGKDNFGLSLWHIDGMLLDFVKLDRRHAHRPAFGMAKTENRLLSYIPPDSLQFWRIERDQLVRTTGYKLPEDDRKCQEIVMSKDGDVAFVVFGDEIELWSEDRGKIRSLLQPYDRVSSITISPDGNMVGVALGEFSTKRCGFCTYTIDGKPGLEINRMPLTYAGPGRYHGNLIAIDPKSRRIARSVKNRVFIYDLRGRLVSEFQVGDDEDENKISALTFSHDGRRLIVAQYWTYTLSVYSDHGDLIKTFRGGDKWGLRCLTLHPDGRHVITGGNDGTVRIWDIETGEQVIFRNEENEWVNYTPDGYFDSSKNGGTQVAMVRNTTPFAVDQFAMTNNRPDIILTRMGLASKDKINHFYLQYQHRIHRAGFTEGQLKQDYHVPTTTLISANQQGKQMLLNFRVRDERYDLKSYNVYVNDVPLFGAYGKKLSGNSARLTETIELSAGANKIEISCFNVAGAESYRAITNARYDEKVTLDFYFLGFGVSRHKNPGLNLGYAHKDALDLAAAFQELSHKPGNVYVKTYTDEQVTVRNIKNAKQFLKTAKVDDIFVLFIAGHGVHERSDEATYYYLTHNAALDNLANTAADFEMIEQLLHGINPRKKLFLMDTCESGELDNATQQAYYALADSRGIKARTSRAVILRERSERPARSYLYQKDRYIYNDLIRRSGAIVFSSSKGGEFSYESDAVQNGFFTEEILNCLTRGAGDENGDGIVTTTELRTYVTTAVAQATDDAQHPTVDRDNIYQKFGFPVK